MIFKKLFNLEAFEKVDREVKLTVFNATTRDSRAADAIGEATFSLLSFLATPEQTLKLVLGKPGASVGIASHSQRHQHKHKLVANLSHQLSYPPFVRHE